VKTGGNSLDSRAASWRSHSAAFDGQHHAARMALEQLDAQRRFETADVVADGAAVSPSSSAALPKF
jgi:hypothetical protein